MERNKKYIFLSILIVSLIIGLSVRKISVGILFDTIIMDSIHENTSFLGITIMEIISFIGSKYFFIIGGSIIYIYFINLMEKRKAKLVLVSISGSFTINIILKYIFKRIRPLNYMLIEYGGYSFPSGHTMVSTTFFLMMTHIILEKIKDEKIKLILNISNIILIGLIGFSRIYLGVHWPTDVLVGHLMGYLVFELIKKRVK